MKDFKYYQPSMIRPEKDDYKIVYIYLNDKLIDTVSWIKYSATFLSYPKGHVKEVVTDEEAFHRDMDEYLRQSKEKADEFRHDLKEEFGISDNPKADKLFNLAWEYGHSGGLNKVYGYFVDFVDLIKD